MKDNIVTAAVIVTAIVVFVVGTIYVSEHVNCFNFFGLAKGCAITR